MMDEMTSIIAAHEQAAIEHQACAEYHSEAALCHTSKAHDDARANAKCALRSCVTANRHSAVACAGSGEDA